MILSEWLRKVIFILSSDAYKQKNPKNLTAAPKTNMWLNATTFVDHAKNRSVLSGALERKFDPTGCNLNEPIFKLSNAYRRKN